MMMHYQVTKSLCFYYLMFFGFVHLCTMLFFIVFHLGKVVVKEVCRAVLRLEVYRNTEVFFVIEYYSQVI